VTDIGVFLLRNQSEQIAHIVSDRIGCTVYRAFEQTTSAQEYFHLHYRKHRQWLLVMTTGIAVRFLDGQIDNKLEDPAVVVLDEAARFAVSLLGGHEGGANKLANEIANIFGSQSVITTATESLKPFVLGVGCRKNVSLEQIENCVNKAFQQLDSNFVSSLNKVRTVATVDLKQNEPALLQFCEKYNLPLRIFAKESLGARAWVGKSSQFVQEVVGADGVCEPCALMVSCRGQLIVPKTTLDGVAIAVVDDSIATGV
jgi:cobalt-precorrin 5A hydrolase